jgi:hypothetical protein
MSLIPNYINGVENHLNLPDGSAPIASKKTPQ